MAQARREGTSTAKKDIMPRHIPEHAIKAMLAREEALFSQRNPTSKKLAEDAAGHWLKGVPMHWMVDWGTPFPLFVTKADQGLTALRRRGRGGDGDALDAYLTLLNAPERPVTLEEVNAAFGNGPKALDIEWFASPADLARLFVHMRKTADPEAFRIMAINPSATGAIKANWGYVGFKGGSEPGVFNLTWLLTDRQGRDWLLSLGWNNPAAVVDEGKLEAIAQRILLLPR